MKIHGLLLAAAFLPVALAAQEDRYAQITNPKLTSINKEPPAAPSPLTRTRRMPLSTTAKNGTFRISLNGRVEIQLCGELRRPPHRLYGYPCRRKQMAGHRRSRQLGAAKVSARLSTSTSRTSSALPAMPLLGQTQPALRSQRVESYGDLPPYLHPACRLGQQRNLPERRRRCAERHSTTSTASLQA